MTFFIHMRDVNDAERILSAFPKRQKGETQLEFLRRNPHDAKDAIVEITDHRWKEYNPMSSSGPGTKDDWCARNNSTICTIDELFETYPEYFI